MKKVIFYISLILILAVSSCKKDNNPIPPEDQPQASITLEDVNCTEVWLKLTTANISLPAEVRLMQDNTVAQTISLSNSDTILYVDSLLPNKTYTFTSRVTGVSEPATSCQ